MASVNKVIIVGNLGKNPELRYTQAGVAFCTFSVATSENWTDQHGNRQEKTEWHKITVWKKQAENCAKYLRKGSSVYVEGRLQTRSWDDQNGQKRYTTEIVANEVKFLSGGQTRASETSRNDESGECPPSEYGMGDMDGGEESLFGSRPSSSLDDIPF